MAGLLALLAPLEALFFGRQALFSVLRQLELLPLVNGLWARRPVAWIWAPLNLIKRVRLF